MGKPYRNELNQLPETFNWASKQNLDSVKNALMACSSRSIVTLGSGGSMAAAEYIAGIHTQLTGRISVAQTPLEFLRTSSRLDQSSVWLLSAGGRNIDILRSMRRAIDVEPAHLAVLCASQESPLARLAATLNIDLLEFSPPAGRDGFLATNSLAAFLLLLSRAYAEIVGREFPNSLQELMHQSMPKTSDLTTLRRSFTPLLEREHWIVLYDPGCRAVALDLESRFSEAALGSIKASDIRNFAHGRHHWLAKRSSSSAVVILSQPGSENVALKSLDLIPRSIPRVQLNFSDNELVVPVGGILLSMEIAGWMGEARNIDPGRPGVPEFGRRLYNLSTLPTYVHKRTLVESIIQRKTRVTDETLRQSMVEKVWKQSLRRFCENLSKTTIRGVVFDYDGTLVDVRHRFLPPNQEIVKALNKLMALGIQIGIATGRGKSVRKDLQKAIPKHFWSQILIGYHNGAELGRLDDDKLPDAVCPDLAPVILEALTLLKEYSPIWDRLTVNTSHSQISLQWSSGIFGWQLWDLIEPIMPALRRLGIIIVSSGHSVDLLAPGVSKRQVISRLSEYYSIAPTEILAIGDRGRSPGNDFELLSHCPALSVDEVSTDSTTCWRLTPPMVNGVAGTLWYLSRLIKKKRFPGSVSFKHTLKF